jgi:hypothetical protein
MKKTIWQPLVLGIILGLLAGISTVTGLSFLIPGTDTENAIGFYITLFLLAAALGGPLAGAIAPAIWVAISAWYGPPELKAIVSIPAVFWSNLLVLGTLMALVGFAYWAIFERVNMPVRLLYWAIIVIAVYVTNSPVIITLQFSILSNVDVLPAILFSYQTYIPQVIFDIISTSLVFIALPTAYTHPLWYESKKALDRASGIHYDLD